MAKNHILWRSGKIKETGNGKALSVRFRSGLPKPQTYFLQVSGVPASGVSENAGDYPDQGDYFRAESFYQRALTIREQALGPEHPDVVNTLANTALMHMASGRFEQAALFQSRAIVHYRAQR